VPPSPFTTRWLPQHCSRQRASPAWETTRSAVTQTRRILPENDSILSVAFKDFIQHVRDEGRAVYRVFRGARDLPLNALARGKVYAKQPVLLAPTAMFLKPLSISLVLGGIAVASVNLHVQDSDFFSVKTQIPVLSTQTEVISAYVDLPFRADSALLALKFEPVGQLNAIKSDQWTTLRHPVFPKYSARIKQTDFCDTTVK
jgi:hypothetical protein